MDQEINEGIAYLIALKQSSTPAGAAAAPARGADGAELANASATPADSAGSQAFASKEKRRTPRYKLDGSAELREEGRNLRTWATFSDISLHGCYVEATATANVGTVLQIKLEANGFRIETRGCVRVSYPSVGMGIAFTEMSEENRTHLRELLATISRPSVIVGPVPGVFAASERSAEDCATDFRSRRGCASPGGVLRKSANAHAKGILTRAALKSAGQSGVGQPFAILIGCRPPLLRSIL
jgi:PilZ domain